MQKIILLFLCFVGSWATLFAQRTQVMTVATVDELINAIESNREIRLKNPKYLLSTLSPVSINPKVRIERNNDGYSIEIQDVKNLKITSATPKGVKILTNTRQAQVLRFKNCENITLENIEAGHAPAQGICTGGVLGFTGCKKISLKNCVLFGSGTEGITLENVSDLQAQSITIKSCTSGIMTMTLVRNVRFQQCRFTDNGSRDLVSVFESENVYFTDCHIDYNHSGRGEETDHYALFNVPLILGITQPVVYLQKCVIEDNYCPYFCRTESTMKLDNCQLDNNIFEKGYKSGK